MNLPPPWPRQRLRSARSLDDPKDPYLVSVRSGARASMPGMMDTILNLGLNDEVVEVFQPDPAIPVLPTTATAASSRCSRTSSWRSRRLNSNRCLTRSKEEVGAKLDTDLDAEAMKEVVARFKAIYKQSKGVEFPQNPREQLIEAVKAVFRSWNNAARSSTGA